MFGREKGEEMVGLRVMSGRTYILPRFPHVRVCRVGSRRVGSLRANVQCPGAAFAISRAILNLKIRLVSTRERSSTEIFDKYKGKSEERERKADNFVCFCLWCKRVSARRDGKEEKEGG